MFVVKVLKFCIYTNILGLSLNMTYIFRKDGFHLTISAFFRSSISIAFNSQKFVNVFIIKIVRMCSMNNDWGKKTCWTLGEEQLSVNYELQVSKLNSRIAFCAFTSLKISAIIYVLNSNKTVFLNLRHVNKFQ